MLTFYVLWKIEKYEESLKYLSICRKAMALLLDEDFASQKNQSLSVIMESTNLSEGRLE